MLKSEGRVAKTRQLALFYAGGCALRAVTLLCALLVLAGCTAGQKQSTTTTTGPPNGVKLGMVTDVGGLGDKSFNDSAYRGLKHAEAVGARIAVLQSRSVNDYEPNLSALAGQGDALIFAIGFLMHDSLNDVAPRFPQTHFAIIDSVVR